MPFLPNTPVIRPTDPGRIGLTTGRVNSMASMTLVEVKWGQGNHQREFVPEQHLKALAEDEQSGEFGRVEDLQRLLTFEKLRGALHDFLYSMDAAQIDFLAYQFRPVLKFIESPTERLLLADEVGLGKTIEAALIWLELQARRDAKRLLVVCPKMIATKWRRELREKFNVPAEIGDAKAMSQKLTDFRRDGERLRFAMICTYDGLRPNKRELPHLDLDDTEELSARGKLAREWTNWADEAPMFDLVIFDEAQAMRNPESARSKLGTALGNAAASVLCVSATPVNNRNTDLFTLLRLLDPDFFDNEFLFNALLEENRPAVRAVKALRRLPRPDLEIARQCLEELRNSKFVGKTEILTRTRELVASLREGDRERLLRAQELTENLNVLGAYISRTQRKQVQERQAVRQVVVVPVRFSNEEMAFYQAITRMVRERVARERTGFSAFHLVMPQRRMASCIPAMVAAFRAGDFGDPAEILSESLDLDPDDFDAEHSAEPPFDMSKLSRHDFEKDDTKYAELRGILRKLGDDKVIIFAFYKATLFYLQRRLEADGLGCALIHGGILDQDDRDTEIERFRDDAKVRVLLSSEVGSEGIDLQFCHVVINYDLPWNPMRVAQRIGRIDRVGQTAEVLHVVHFKVRGTIEERVFERLRDKYEMAENSLGDMEIVLGEEIQKLTIDLLSQQLTPEQEETRIEQTARALEQQRLELERLESEGGSLLAHSDYIADKVGQNRSLGRYLSAEEIHLYIDDFFRSEFRGCRLQWNYPERDLFHLDLTHEAHESLRDFVRDSKIDAPSEQIAQRITGTLIPDIARAHRVSGKRKLVLVNHLAPLVKWITHYFQQHGAKSFFERSAVRLIDPMLPPGLYTYRIERWRFTGLREQNFLAYAAAHLEDATLLAPDEAELFVNALVKRGKSWLDAEFPADAVLSALGQLQDNLSGRLERQFDDFKVRNDSLVAIQHTQIETHFRRRREIGGRRVETARLRGLSPGRIRGFEAMLAQDVAKEQQRLAELARKSKTDPEFREVAVGIAQIGDDGD